MFLPQRIVHTDNTLHSFVDIYLKESVCDFWHGVGSGEKKLLD